MIMQAEVKQYYSPEEYLELEVNSEEKHEYIDGEIVLMTGAMPNHNRITLNLAGFLNSTLEEQPYDVFVNDQRLWIPKRRIYTYPDVMVVRGDLEFQERRRDTITNPVAIAEVLSKSTQSYDRSEKFQAYRTIPSFQEYVLIDQYSMQVERYYKQEQNQWIFSEYDDAESILKLNSVPCEISLAKLYNKVDFEVEQNSNDN